ncbi:hypothetical protein [Streptomyces sp. BV286]|uniref:hypothetical protein n=1 Tax=unclassified Streptomyces TaxID=2593676 RepID=UPI001C2E1E64|nr:hypothetical protein [Streptomyces sp. BV286]MBV1938564.1 hypothetical protein [Streptomyces sp. BV286]
MAPKNDHSMSLRAVRQLHRMRAFYAAAVLLWAASAAWTGWAHPGSRQMWVSALFLLVFAGLLSVTSLWLRRLQDSGADKPAHHAAPRRVPARRHVNA